MVLVLVLAVTVALALTLVFGVGGRERAMGGVAGMYSCPNQWRLSSASRHTCAMFGLSRGAKWLGWIPFGYLFLERGGDKPRVLQYSTCSRMTGYSRSSR